MALTSEGLRQFLNVHLGVDTSAVDNDTLLYSSGLVDSLGMVDMIVFIESEARLTMEPDDLVLENLDSIGQILAYVRSRSREGASSVGWT